MSNDFEYSRYTGSSSSTLYRDVCDLCDVTVSKMMSMSEGESGPQPKFVIDYEVIKNELKTIAEEQEKDKEKYLPKFDPEDLDV